jgi:hypothetical protein
MTLKEYIRIRGVQNCATEWNVTRMTVYNWLNGKSWPSRNRHLPRILATTKLTAEQIYR